MTGALAQDAIGVLTSLLASGPQESRAIVASMGQKGFTPKQVRRARERLQLALVRKGAGPSTRTMWSFPEKGRQEGTTEAGSGGVVPVGMPVGGPERRVELLDDGAEGAGIDRESSRAQVGKVKVSAHLEDGLQPFERQRVARRIELFMAKGIAADEAAGVARLLVFSRDRTGTRDVSCAECQCFHAGRCSAAGAGYGSGPRPVCELWMCGYSRRDGP